ncbi:MAG: adenylate kinase [bacterium]
MRLVLLGAPGSGKGTQAERLADRFDVVHISTGDILRQNVKDGTELGSVAKSYMDKGELVPDCIIVDMVGKRIRERDCEGGFVLDGFPRTLEQAVALDRILKDTKLGLDFVVNIEVGDAEVIRRLSGRRVCRRCGAVYHISFSPPERDEVCDRCGGELYQRDDDREETIENRLEVYRKQTKPLIQYYADSGLLKDIDGEDSVDAVFERILSAVGG